MRRKEQIETKIERGREKQDKRVDRDYGDPVRSDLPPGQQGSGRFSVGRGMFLWGQNWQLNGEGRGGERKRERE